MGRLSVNQYRGERKLKQRYKLSSFTVETNSVLLWDTSKTSFQTCLTPHAKRTWLRKAQVLSSRPYFVYPGLQDSLPKCPSSLHPTSLAPATPVICTPKGWPKASLRDIDRAWIYKLGICHCVEKELEMERNLASHGLGPTPKGWLSLHHQVLAQKYDKSKTFQFESGLLG